MVKAEYLFLGGFKMDTKRLSIQILRDASKEDLIPISLLRRYDVSTNAILCILNLLIHSGKLILSPDNKLKITKKGLDEIEKTDNEASIEEHHSKRPRRKVRKRLNVNEPYLPIIQETIKNRRTVT